jgi:catechol 2,3-dioxygenase-like lactoylglutathione lyase family enzyme
MLSHTHVGVNDFDRALDFYSKIMGALGCPLKFLEPEKPWAGWKPPDADRPLLVMGKPENGEPAVPGNGQMVALLAPSREVVDYCYGVAIAAGARSEGQPGLRPQDHPSFYGAYFSRSGRQQDLCLLSHAKAVARGKTV